MTAATANVRQSETAAKERPLILIREAVESELVQIVAIYNAAVATRVATAQLEPVTVESRRHWLKGDYPFLVAELDGIVAGWVSLKKFLPRCAYRGTAELSVYVSERSRRRRIARSLLEEAIARAPQLELHSLVGLIFGDNAASLRLFEQLGFARWGLLPGIARVEDQSRDLIIVGRHV
jgi:L-amino acid N-acyltransferase YncA